MESPSDNPMKEKRLAAFSEIDLYPVTCEERSRSRSDEEVVKAIIDGGARIIQLRDKNSTKSVLFDKAKKIKELCNEADILLIVNDHIDIALAVDADGVHLGLDDMPLIEAKRLLPDKIVGASTHTLREALIAEKLGADYINIGPIFPTKTKDGGDKFLGADIISSIASHMTIPFTVMGGINSDNLATVLDKGAKKVAMVTGITEEGNITKAVRSIREKITSAQK